MREKVPPPPLLCAGQGKAGPGEERQREQMDNAGAEEEEAKLIQFIRKSKQGRTERCLARACTHEFSRVASFESRSYRLRILVAAGALQLVLQRMRRIRTTRPAAVQAAAAVKERALDEIARTIDTLVANKGVRTFSALLLYTSTSSVCVREGANPQLKP